MVTKVYVQDAEGIAIYHKETQTKDRRYKTACGRPIRFTQHTVRVPEDMTERLNLKPCAWCYKMEEDHGGVGSD